MANQGTFIVLEGADGSGKGTQFKLLTERLKAVGYDVEVFDFPRYDEPSSHFVRSYLNGEYGSASDISPYTASLFYALDRFEASPKIKKALDQDKIVLSNRYVGSNMAHQGGKFTNSGEQRGFFIWEDGLEFEMLGIPRPTINIFLRVPAEVSFELIGKKAKRSYTDKTHDQHEQDLDHLKNSIRTYDTLCQLFPKDFKAIECAPDNKLLDIPEINDMIWKIIKPILPPKPQHPGRDVVVNLNNAHAPSQNIKSISTPTVTSSPKTQDSNNLNITIKKVSKLAASQLQAIAGIKCEAVSKEWPLENAYNFYTPVELPKNLLAKYKQSLEKMGNLHKRMSAHDHDGTTPMSALTTIKISGQPGEILNLIMQLRQSPLSEVRWVAEQLQAGTNKLQPETFGPVAPKEDLLKTQDSVLSKIASKNLTQNISSSYNPVTLQEAIPRNEFMLLVDALYPYSTSSRVDIIAELEKWTYDQKTEAFAASLSDNNSPILKQVRYRWNLVIDGPVFNTLTENLAIDDLQVQPNTPQYGYDIPKKIKQSDMDELYIECFRESSKLFNILQESGFGHLAEYATLSGHKNRWQFTTSAKALKTVGGKTLSNSARELLTMMVEKVNERHPLIGAYLNKSNQPAPKVREKPDQTPRKSSSHRRRRTRKPKK